jgi:hypothetical protein
MPTTWRLGGEENSYLKNDDEDVEGHTMRVRNDDADVEGHSLLKNDDEDVEGHKR